MHGIVPELAVLIKVEPHTFFDTDHLKSDLKGRSVRGGAITVTTQVIKFLLQTGSTVVLARLLTPEDYGLLAMVIAITGFIGLFQDMGLSVATIQKTNINHSQVSNLFWINVVVSLALGLILAASAPIISWFYGEPRLTLITLIFASTFILSGLTIQHMALLKRQMLFKDLATIEIGSMGVGIIVGIVLAYYGVGYWALVGLSVATGLSYAVLAWVFCGWRPGLPVRGVGILSMVKFGGHIIGFDVVNYFSRNFDKILLGRFYGASVLGLYDKAYNIMMLPVRQVRWPLYSVAIPALSHIHNDSIRYKSYYTKLVTIIAFITMPLMVFLFACADQVILLLLGSQWLGAAVIFKILCINAFLQPTLGTAGLVPVTLGQGKRYFIMGTINGLIIVISFILGLPWGAIGVAVSYTIATYVTLVPMLWYCYRRSPISIKDFFSSVFRPAIASMIMGLAILAIRLFLTDVSYFTLIGFSFVVGFLTYILVLVLMPGGLLLLNEFYSYRSFLFQKST